MTTGPGLRALHEVSFADLESVGGKAAALGEIARAGCRVPQGFVVPCAYRRRVLARELEPTVFEAQVRERCDALGERFFAVRSSGVGEDGVRASWAGQFATYLGVRAEEVVARIHDCWCSPGSAHATAYAARHGASESRWDLAVIVQAMVAAEISGVLFTVDPVSKDPRLCSLEVVVGLAEPLVQGEVTPQSYLIDRASGRVVDHHQHDQHTALRLTEAGLQRVALVPDEAGMQGRGLLSELIDIGIRLERQFGRPQDIEWACARGVVSIIQSRPITTV